MKALIRRRRRKRGTPGDLVGLGGWQQEFIISRRRPRRRGLKPAWSRAQFSANTESHSRSYYRARARQKRQNLKLYGLQFRERGRKKRIFESRLSTVPQRIPARRNFICYSSRDLLHSYVSLPLFLHRLPSTRRNVFTSASSKVRRNWVLTVRRHDGRDEGEEGIAPRNEFALVGDDTQDIASDARWMKRSKTLPVSPNFPSSSSRFRARRAHPPRRNGRSFPRASQTSKRALRALFFGATCENGGWTSCESSAKRASSIAR